jgi:hypothetical protein
MAMGAAKSVWSGHSCPLPLTLVLLLILVWSGHPAGGSRGGFLMRRVQSKGKVKIRVKGSGQECPLYTKTNGDSRSSQRGGESQSNVQRTIVRDSRSPRNSHHNLSSSASFKTLPAWGVFRNSLSSTLAKCFWPLMSALMAPFGVRTLSL